MANGEADIIRASNGTDAGQVAIEYAAYVASMTAAKQPIRALKDILGR